MAENETPNNGEKYEYDENGYEIQTDVRNGESVDSHANSSDAAQPTLNDVVRVLGEAGFGVGLQRTNETGEWENAQIKFYKDNGEPMVIDDIDLSAGGERKAEVLKASVENLANSEDLNPQIKDRLEQANKTLKELFDKQTQTKENDRPRPTETEIDASDAEKLTTSDFLEHAKTQYPKIDWSMYENLYLSQLQGDYFLSKDGKTLYVENPDTKKLSETSVRKIVEERVEKTKGLDEAAQDGRLFILREQLAESAAGVKILEPASIMRKARGLERAMQDQLSTEMSSSHRLIYEHIQKNYPGLESPFNGQKISVEATNSPDNDMLWELQAVMAQGNERLAASPDGSELFIVDVSTGEKKSTDLFEVIAEAKSRNPTAAALQNERLDALEKSARRIVKHIETQESIELYASLKEIKKELDKAAAESPEDAQQAAKEKAWELGINASDVTEKMSSLAASGATDEEFAKEVEGIIKSEERTMLPQTEILAENGFVWRVSDEGRKGTLSSENEDVGFSASYDEEGITVSENGEEGRKIKVDAGQEAQEIVESLAKEKLEAQLEKEGFVKYRENILLKTSETENGLKVTEPATGTVVLDAVETKDDVKKSVDFAAAESGMRPEEFIASKAIEAGTTAADKKYNIGLSKYISGAHEKFKSIEQAVGNHQRAVKIATSAIKLAAMVCPEIGIVNRAIGMVYTAKNVSSIAKSVKERVGKRNAEKTTVRSAKEWNRILDSIPAPKEGMDNDAAATQGAWNAGVFESDLVDTIKKCAAEGKSRKETVAALQETEKASTRTMLPLNKFLAHNGWKWELSDNGNKGTLSSAHKDADMSASFEKTAGKTGITIKGFGGQEVSGTLQAGENPMSALEASLETAFREHVAEQDLFVYKNDLVLRKIEGKNGVDIMEMSSGTVIAEGLDPKKDIEKQIEKTAKRSDAGRKTAGDPVYALAASKMLEEGKVPPKTTEYNMALRDYTGRVHRIASSMADALKSKETYKKALSTAITAVRITSLVVPPLRTVSVVANAVYTVPNIVKIVKKFSAEEKRLESERAKASLTDPDAQLRNDRKRSGKEWAKAWDEISKLQLREDGNDDARIAAKAAEMGIGASDIVRSMQTLRLSGADSKTAVRELSSIAKSESREYQATSRLLGDNGWKWSMSDGGRSGTLACEADGVKFSASFERGRPATAKIEGPDGNEYHLKLSGKGDIQKTLETAMEGAFRDYLSRENIEVYNDKLLLQAVKKEDGVDIVEPATGETLETGLSPDKDIASQLDSIAKEANMGSYENAAAAKLSRTASADGKEAKGLNKILRNRASKIKERMREFDGYLDTHPKVQKALRIAATTIEVAAVVLPLTRVLGNTIAQAAEKPEPAEQQTEQTQETETQEEEQTQENAQENATQNSPRQGIRRSVKTESPDEEPAQEDEDKTARELRKEQREEEHDLKDDQRETRREMRSRQREENRDRRQDARESRREMREQQREKEAEHKDGEQSQSPMAEEPTTVIGKGGNPFAKPITTTDEKAPQTEDPSTEDESLSDMKKEHAAERSALRKQRAEDREEMRQQHREERHNLREEQKAETEEMKAEHEQEMNDLKEKIAAKEAEAKQQATQQREEQRAAEKEQRQQEREERHAEREQKRADRHAAKEESVNKEQKAEDPAEQKEEPRLSRAQQRRLEREQEGAADAAVSEATFADIIHPSRIKFDNNLVKMDNHVYSKSEFTEMLEEQAKQNLAAHNMPATDENIAAVMSTEARMITSGNTTLSMSLNAEKGFFLDRKAEAELVRLSESGPRQETAPEEMFKIGKQVEEQHSLHEEQQAEAEENQQESQQKQEQRDAEKEQRRQEREERHAKREQERAERHAAKEKPESEEQKTEEKAEQKDEPRLSRAQQRKLEREQERAMESAAADAPFADIIHPSRIEFDNSLVKTGGYVYSKSEFTAMLEEQAKQNLAAHNMPATDENIAAVMATEARMITSGNTTLSMSLNAEKGFFLDRKAEAELVRLSESGPRQETAPEEMFKIGKQATGTFTAEMDRGETNINETLEELRQDTIEIQEKASHIQQKIESINGKNAVEMDGQSASRRIGRSGKSVMSALRDESVSPEAAAIAETESQWNTNESKLIDYATKDNVYSPILRRYIENVSNAERKFYEAKQHGSLADYHEAEQNLMRQRQSTMKLYDDFIKEYEELSPAGKLKFEYQERARILESEIMGKIPESEKQKIMQELGVQNEADMEGKFREWTLEADPERHNFNIGNRAAGEFTAEMDGKEERDVKGAAVQTFEAAAAFGAAESLRRKTTPKKERQAERQEGKTGDIELEAAVSLAQQEAEPAWEEDAGLSEPEETTVPTESVEKQSAAPARKALVSPAKLPTIENDLLSIEGYKWQSATTADGTFAAALVDRNGLCSCIYRGDTDEFGRPAVLRFELDNAANLHMSLHPLQTCDENSSLEDVLKTIEQSEGASLKYMQDTRTTDQKEMLPLFKYALEEANSKEGFVQTLAERYPPIAETSRADFSEQISLVPPERRDALFKSLADNGMNTDSLYESLKQEGQNLGSALDRIAAGRPPVQSAEEDYSRQDEYYEEPQSEEEYYYYEGMEEPIAAESEPVAPPPSKNETPHEARLRVLKAEIRKIEAQMAQEKAEEQKRSEEAQREKETKQKEMQAAQRPEAAPEKAAQKAAPAMPRVAAEKIAPVALNTQQQKLVVQFLGMLGRCETYEDMDRLINGYSRAGEYSFVTDPKFQPSRQGLDVGSYKMRLMDKTRALKAEYGLEGQVPVCKPVHIERKKDYTLSDFMSDARSCKTAEQYEKVFNKAADLVPVYTKRLSKNTTALYIDKNSLPSMLADTGSVEKHAKLFSDLEAAGYMPNIPDLPSPESVYKNGMTYLEGFLDGMESRREAHTEDYLRRAGEAAEEFSASEEGPSASPEWDDGQGGPSANAEDGREKNERDVPSFPASKDDIPAATTEEKIIYFDKNGNACGYETSDALSKSIDEIHKVKREDPQMARKLSNQVFMKHAYEIGCPVPKMTFIGPDGESYTRERITFEGVEDPQNAWGKDASGKNVVDFSKANTVLLMAHKYHPLSEGSVNPDTNMVEEYDERIPIKVDGFTYRKMQENAAIIGNAPAITEEVQRKYNDAIEKRDTTEMPNTAENFFHNYSIKVRGCMNETEAMKVAASMVKAMSYPEKQRMRKMMYDYENHKSDSAGRHLSYDQMLINEFKRQKNATPLVTQENIIKGEDHAARLVDPRTTYDDQSPVLDAIKFNTNAETKYVEGTPLGEGLSTKIGDTVSLALEVPSIKEMLHVHHSPVPFLHICSAGLGAVALDIHQTAKDMKEMSIYDFVANTMGSQKGIFPFKQAKQLTAGIVALAGAITAKAAGTAVDGAFNFWENAVVKTGQLVMGKTPDGKVPRQDYKITAYSKENDTVTLTSLDGKSKILKPYSEFKSQLQKMEKNIQRNNRKKALRMSGGMEM